MSVVSAIQAPDPFWRDFTSRIVMAGIKAASITPTERKERIMWAWEAGFLSAEAAEDFIVFWGLVHE